MKILQISVDGLPLFKDKLKLDFYAQQRVSENDTNSLFPVTPNLYINCVNAIVGINASGKTTLLKTVIFALNLLQNKPINHISTKNILGDSSSVVFDIIFCSASGAVCKLNTCIKSKKDSLGNVAYFISSETLYVKNIVKSASKKVLLDFSTAKPSINRNNIDGLEDFLPDDVSIIIAYNKKNKDVLNVTEMLFLTDVNLIPYSQVQIPMEIVEFLDPSIESLFVTGKTPDKAQFHIKFKNSNEIIVEKQSDLNNYLSSGTIKGVTLFLAILSALSMGSYLVIDEIENHFNKEIVATILRFFMDLKTNPNGAVLIYSSHYPELLDEHKRNDSIYITKNLDGIKVENLSESLKRNDIKKSDAFQSGYLDGTAPSYSSYIKLKNYIKNFLGEA